MDNECKEILQLEIEDTRAKLETLINAKQGNLLHPEVIELSKYLDQLIARYVTNATRC